MRQLVLVLGAHGQLGEAMTALLEPRHEVVARGRDELDVTVADAVRATVGSICPDVIINCAAYTSVDAAQQEPSRALATNAWAVHTLARAAADIDATLVHFSTDFVFDGETTAPYDETSPPNPRGAYAVSKLVELHLRFHGYGEGGWTDSAVRRYVRDAGDQLERLHILTRADCTTRNRRKAERLRRTYDDLEARIARLSEEEELASIRPDLDGNKIMEILGIPPGRDVGAAYNYLLELRMEEGPLGEEEAYRRLDAWWATRNSS